MRLFNLAVLIVIVCGVVATGSCLVAIHKGIYELETLSCGVLGPGLVAIAIGFFGSVCSFVVGFACRLIDDEFNLIKSLYTFNLALIATVLFVLFFNPM